VQYLCRRTVWGMWNLSTLDSVGWLSRLLSKLALGALLILGSMCLSGCGLFVGRSDARACDLVGKINIELLGGTKPDLPLLVREAEYSSKSNPRLHSALEKIEAGMHEQAEASVDIQKGVLGLTKVSVGLADAREACGIAAPWLGRSWHDQGGGVVVG